jgi:phosphate:Na+ symporter
MDAGTETLSLTILAMELLGGLALFLFGMEQLTDGLKAVAGGGMKRVLARLTTNRFKAAFAGAFVTAVIQSSSVTTVLVVGFASAGLMTLGPSIGVIMGANIGTTVTAQIIAFKVTKYALVLVAIGFGLLFMGKSDRVRCYGAMLMGLGLIFFGMELMSTATRPLRSYEPFIDTMRSMSNPVLGILIGAAFTSVVQSSSATTGVVIVLASQGFISLEAGIALIFGANIGTCVTALLATAGKPREAVRAGMVHVVFNVLGVVLWLGFIGYLAQVVRWISPTAEHLEGASRLAVETPRQIANAHTIFNVANTLIFIWFTGPIAKLVKRLVPVREETEPQAIEPQYLDDVLLDTPDLALDRVRMEVRRMGEMVTGMAQGSLAAVVDGTEGDLQSLRAADNDVDALHGAIVAYLGELSQGSVSSDLSGRLRDYVSAANYLENIGDTIETNLVEAGFQRLNTNLEISEGTREVLGRLHTRVLWSVDLAVKAMAEWDGDLAEEITRAKDEINDLANQADVHLGTRLTADAPNRLQAFRIESDVIENYKRIYYFAKRVAKVVTEADAEDGGETLAA